MVEDMQARFAAGSFYIVDIDDQQKEDANQAANVVLRSVAEHLVSPGSVSRLL